jgi:hypothetical protein
MHRLFFFQQKDCSKLIRPDLIQTDLDAQLQRCPEIERAPQQQTRLGRLRRIEPVQRAVAAAAAIVGSVQAKAGIAEFLTAERPMNQKSQRRFFGPLPASQFGSRCSSNTPSSASIAALTATAW